jgi:hypothetical protein
MSKAAQKKYEQVFEGDWYNLDWGHNYEMCCDCSMVHETAYRVKDGKIQRKVKVDRPRTYQARRRAGIKIERKQ